MKIFFLSFFIFLLLIIMPLTSATKITLSPSTLNFLTKPDQTSCKEIILSLDPAGEILINDVWTTRSLFKKKINMYGKQAKSLGISIDYPNQTLFEQDKSSKKIKICLKSNQTGRFYGAIIFKTKDNAAAIGSWIDLIVLEKADNLILKPVFSNILMVFALISQSVLLSTFFIILVLFKKRANISH